MSLNDLVIERLTDSAKAVAALEQESTQITAACELVLSTIRSGGMIATCGNGGSAAQALHLAEELMGRYRSDRRALPGICLNADPTLLTCIANDYGFEAVFSRQCDALLGSDDLLIVLSTSGRSANLQQALEIARSKGAHTLGLLGPTGSACEALCDVTVCVPGNDSGVIQDGHQIVLHVLCEAVEQAVVANSV